MAGGIELDTVLRFVDIAVDALSEAREEIDALNVYPVPDSDTGTNMYLTIAAARDGMREVPGAPRRAGLAAFSRGALLGARGNSGVILSEMLGAIARRISSATADDRNAEVMAEALRQATKASYAAVGEPRRGHHAHRARAAADAPWRRQGPRRPDPRRAPGRRCRRREALGHTPEQLEVLAAPGSSTPGAAGSA